MAVSADTIYDMVGLIGVGVYICSYAGLQLGMIRGASLPHTLLNLTAASLVLISLTNEFNLSSAIIQVTWITISVVGLIRLAYLTRMTRLNAEETRFLGDKLHGFSRPMAREFLNAGLWIDLPPGEAIVTQGQAARALIYISEGTSDVLLDGAIIGTCQAGSFIGELTCFDGGPATATVIARGPCRVFRIGTENLNRLCDRNGDLKLALENTLGRDTRMKLVATNARLREVGKNA